MAKEGVKMTRLSMRYILQINVDYRVFRDYSYLLLERKVT